MSKIVLNDVTNLNTLSVINDNFDKLEQELQNKVLYRNNPEGEPNALQNDVDANGNSIYNVQDLTITGDFTVNGQDISVVISEAVAGIEENATAAENAALAAGVSAANALASANAADISEANALASQTSATASASTATTQAGIATTGATTATTQAGIATTKASEASASASSAATSASTATTQAGIATTQANTATAQATAASTAAADAAASAAAAATALDNFDDRYLGAKASAPTLDNDGNALIQGALYFNNGSIVSADKGMWIYDGGIWIKASSASQAILTTYKFIATAGQTNFSGTDVNGFTLAYTAGSIIPTLNGSAIDKTDYTATTGALFTLANAASAGDEIVINAFSTFNIANTYTQAQVDSFTVKLTGDQTITGVKTLSGKLDMTGVISATGNMEAIVPTRQGVFLGADAASPNNRGIDICAGASALAWLDFTSPNADFKGRIVYDNAANNMDFSTNGLYRARIDSSGNLLFNSGYGSVATAYGCRAWINFNGSGTISIRASGNVSSIVDNGVGDYTVNFITGMPDVNYSASLGCTRNYDGDASPMVAVVKNSTSNIYQSTSSVRMETRYTTPSTLADPIAVYVSIFR